MALGPEIGDIAPVEDLLGNFTDGDDPRNDQTRQLAAVFGDLVEIGHGNEQLVSTAGNNQERGVLQDFGDPLGGGSADLDMIDDAPGIAFVTLQRKFEQIGHPPECRIGKYRLVVKACQYLQALRCKNTAQVIENRVPLVGEKLVCQNSTDIDPFLLEQGKVHMHRIDYIADSSACYQQNWCIQHAGNMGI